MCESEQENVVSDVIFVFQMKMNGEINYCLINCTGCKNLNELYCNDYVDSNLFTSLNY